MGHDLTEALRMMEERITKVKQYVNTLEDENSELRLQLEILEENLEKQGKGEGSVLARKNLRLTESVRSYRREREFLSEKIKSLLDEVRELMRNVD